MGSDKAWLTLGGKPVIGRVIAAVEPLGIPLALVADEPSSDRLATLGLPVWTDLIPQRGPLGGLHTGFDRSDSERLLVLACDLPFMTAALLRFLASLTPRGDAVIPEAADQLQPLCALYTRSCLSALEDCISGPDLSMTGFVARLDSRIVKRAEYAHLDPHEIIFANLNTPEDYEKARERVERLENGGATGEPAAVQV